MKKAIVMLACVFGLSALFSGCQPTPDAPVVVNRSEGLPQNALKDAPSEASGQPAHFEPVTYTASGHWTDTIDKGEAFSVSADVDVMMPDVQAYPVQKLASADITQERADELIAYFAGEDAEFYQMPLPLTKAEYEAQLVDLRESLAQVEAGGDGETPDSLRSYIAETEEKWRNAPEENELVKADTTFTYMRDYETGEPQTAEGEYYISLAVIDDSGISKSIDAGRAHGDNTTAYFYYNECSSSTKESWVLQEQEYNKQDRESAQYAEEPYKSEALQYVQEQEERVQKELDALAKNDVDLGAMQQKAISILEDLGIDGVQIKSCEKALYSEDTQPLGSTWSREYVDPSEPGCQIEFSRECGGMPCVAQNGGQWGDDMSAEGMYCAPFYPEQGTMLLDADGNVKMFSWNSIAQVVENVSGDSDILSFDEIKDRAVDHLYWYNMPHYEDDNVQQDYEERFRYEVEEVKLVMAYIDVKDEPDNVMAVPAWYVKAKGYATFIDHTEAAANNPRNGVETQWNDGEVMINALDGSPILLPGITREIEDVPEASAPPDGGEPEE